MEKALIKDLEVVKSTDGLSLWRTDFDGMQFFNFLGVGPQYVVKTSLHDPKLATFALKSTFAYLKKNRAMVKQSPQLYSKFSWLAKYYNLVCAEFPMFQMDSFTFE